jgi:3-oxoacyl-[acyl-carrier-protein] synthase III
MTGHNFPLKKLFKMKAYIKALSYYLPEEKLTNHKLNEIFPDWSVDKISAKTGIMERRIAGPAEFSSDLAIKSAQVLFEDHNISPNEVDFILLCTQSPDYFLPTTACLVQTALGIPTSAGALDFNLGCSGFVYGLGLAKGLIESGQAKNVLLLTAETYSKFIHPEDKSVRTIFGDAAAATLISGDSERDAESLYAFTYGTDGKGANNLIVKAGGMRQPFNGQDTQTIDSFGNIHTDSNLYMNGSEIFVFTLASVPKLIEAVLIKSQLSLDQVDLIIFHQANAYMLEALRKKIKIPEEKFFVFLENCGNTVSSTIPIALSEAVKSGKAKKGDTILIAGFGVGYSWGGCVVKI